MQIENRLSPVQCTGMDDIRVEIDSLNRGGYQPHRQTLLIRPPPVVTFKMSATSGYVPERIKAMPEKRLQWAGQESLSLETETIARFGLAKAGATQLLALDRAPALEIC